MSFFSCCTANDQFILQVCCLLRFSLNYVALHIFSCLQANGQGIQFVMCIHGAEDGIRWAWCKKSCDRKWKQFYLSHSDFDEINLQKCEEYFGGETFGVDERVEIFKGMFSFMLVGLKSNTHFIINCVTEREVNGY